ncbi:hypothetical protein ACWDNI_35800 [Nocardia niigatensis]
MAEVDHFYLDRAQISALRELLGRVPVLAEDLAVAETKQARITKAGLGAPRAGRHCAALPLNADAYEAREGLHNALTTWVRAVCEQRAISVPAVDNLTAAAAWLRRNVYALAMTEGADDAPREIGEAYDDCRAVIDLPPDDEVVVDSARLAAANASVHTAYSIEKLAPKLGEIGKGLNRDRVRYLAKRGLRECGRDGDTRFYRLGDVLVAHMQHKAKGRGAA